MYYGNPSEKKRKVIILVILKDEQTGRNEITLPFNQHLLCVRQFARHFTFTYYTCLHNKGKRVPVEADAFSKGLRSGESSRSE